MYRYLLLALCAALLFGCEKSKPTTPAEAPTTQDTSGLLQKSIKPVVMELPTEALAAWREQQATKPALVLFSSHPMLKTIPESLTVEALKLAAEGTVEDLRQQGSFFAADPLLLPEQTLSAAIGLNLVSEIYWVYPGQGTTEEIDAVKFRDELANRSFITPEESAQFKLKDGIVSGVVRGTPLHLVHPNALPQLKRPILLHIDLSYLTSLYRNEEGTPAYQLLTDFTLKLRNTAWQVAETTISYSNAEGRIPLDLRFLATDLARIFREPELIGATLPRTWQLRSEGLEQTTLLQHDKAFAAYRQAQELSPDDASIQFDLYLSLSELKKAKQALAALDRAVELDPGYAFEYLKLVRPILQQGGYVEAVALLERAATKMVNPALIQMQLADTQLRSGHSDVARATIRKLWEYQWSETYHKSVLDDLSRLEQRLNEMETLEK